MLVIYLVIHQLKISRKLLFMMTISCGNNLILIHLNLNIIFNIIELSIKVKKMKLWV